MGYLYKLHGLRRQANELEFCCCLPLLLQIVGPVWWAASADNFSLPWVRKSTFMNTLSVSNPVLSDSISLCVLLFIPDPDLFGGLPVQIARPFPSKLID